MANIIKIETVKILKSTNMVFSNIEFKKKVTIQSHLQSSPNNNSDVVLITECLETAGNIQKAMSSICSRSTRPSVTSSRLSHSISCSLPFTCLKLLSTLIHLQHTLLIWLLNIELTHISLFLNQSTSSFSPLTLLFVVLQYLWIRNVLFSELNHNYDHFWLRCTQQHF